MNMHDSNDKPLKSHVLNLASDKHKANAGDMTDSTSSESGGSGYSRRNSRRIRRTDCPLSNPKFTNYDSPNDDMSFSVDEQSLVGNATQHFKGNRETVRQAVEIVLNATAKKRRMKGAISLCTEVAKLLDDISRLEHQVIVLKMRDKDGSKGSGHTGSSLISSTESNKSENQHAMQTKTIQVQPILTDRSTSPLLKEVHMKNASTIACQTEVTSDTEKENVRLKKQLYAMRIEMEELRKKQTILPMIVGSQRTASKAGSQPDHQKRGTNIVPVSPVKRRPESVDHQVELPHIPPTKNPSQLVDCNKKILVHQQRRKGYRPLSSPPKGSCHQPIRPNEMYSQCKCKGCVRALAEESEITLAGYTDKKSPKSEILPSIGDHIVVRSHLTGTVKYVGPVNGEEAYIGLHLDSPVGNHSGSLDGVHYFSCPPNYGAFVHIDDVLCITTSKEKQAVGFSTGLQKSFPNAFTALYPKKKNVPEGS